MRHGIGRCEMTELTPTGDNTFLRETTALREVGWLERFLGPENYRILTGLLKTPASIFGFILIGLFIFIAVAAPLIMPPVTPNDPFKIPRDGFSPNPQPMGSPWRRNVPALPF